MELVVRMMVLLLCVTYSHCSGHLMLLHQIRPQVVARKPLMNFLSFHVTQQVQKDMVAAVHAGDMEVFSVAYVSGSIARQVLHGVSCDAHKTCVTSEVLLSANIFIYF